MLSSSLFETLQYNLPKEPWHFGEYGDETVMVEKRKDLGESTSKKTEPMLLSPGNSKLVFRHANPSNRSRPAKSNGSLRLSAGHDHEYQVWRATATGFSFCCVKNGSYKLISFTPDLPSSTPVRRRFERGGAKASTPATGRRLGKGPSSRMPTHINIQKAHPRREPPLNYPPRATLCSPDKHPFEQDVSREARAIRLSIFKAFELPLLWRTTKPLQLQDTHNEMNATYIYWEKLLQEHWRGGFKTERVGGHRVGYHRVGWVAHSATILTDPRARNMSLQASTIRLAVSELRSETALSIKHLGPEI
ncbi:hypothetical protein ACJZ2D_004669 [Fusarium nematophilum]